VWKGLGRGFLNPPGNFRLLALKTVSFGAFCVVFLQFRCLFTAVLPRVITVDRTRMYKGSSRLQISREYSKCCMDKT